MKELGLDETPDNEALISSLVADAQLITLDSISSTATQDDYKDNNLFNRAVKTLATQLFYDRTLSEGTSLGYQMIVTHLQMGVLSSADTNATSNENI